MLYTENALAHQACVLRSDLEKSIQDNASLFMKIGMYSVFSLIYIHERIHTLSLHLYAAREDKLSAGNRSVVNKFESELAQDVGSLCNMVAASVSQQNEQLLCIEKFCDTFISISDKVLLDLCHHIYKVCSYINGI